MTLYHDGLHGFDSAIFYNRTSQLPVALLRILNSMEIARNRGAVSKLTGGNFPGAVAVESGEPENPISMEVREYPNVVFSALEDATVTENAAEASGNFGTIINSVGTSVFDATTGIATIAADSSNLANIPFGRIVIKATGATTVDIYVAGKLQGSGNFQDKLALVAENITIPGTGGTVDVNDLGITITGGSGAIAFTVDDVAYQDVRGVNQGNSVVEVGDVNDRLTEYGIFLMWPKLANGSFMYADIHRAAITSGVPLMGTYRDWATYTIEGEILADLCNGGKLWTVYKIEPDTTC